MLEFSDAPYRFFELKPSPILIRLGRQLNKRFILPGKNHQISEVVIDGELEAIREISSDGGRLMFAIFQS